MVKRLISVDIIRVLAMLMVVYLHTCFGISIRPDFFSTKAWFIFEPFAALSKTSIALFFMLSGFLVINKKRTFKENWLITKNRIIVPLIFFTVINIILQIYKYKLSFGKGLWHYFSADLSNFPNNWLWFLMALLFMYILNPVWQIIFSKGQKSETAIYLTIFFFIFSIITGFIKFIDMKNMIFFNSFTLWLVYLFFYLYGGLVKNNWINFNRRNINLSLIFIGWLIIMIGDYYTLYAQTHSIKFIFAGYFLDYLSLPVILLAVGIFNFLISSDNQRLLDNIFKGTILKIIQILATLSFGIYLIHPLIINIFADILGVNFDNMSISIYLFNIVNFIVVLGTGALITFIILKIPKLKIIIGGRSN